MGDAVDTEMASANGEMGVVSWLKRTVSMVKVVRWALEYCAGYLSGTLLIVALPLEAGCQDAKTPRFEVPGIVSISLGIFSSFP